MVKEDIFTEKEAIELLRKYSNGDETAFTVVLEHSLAVKKVAEKILNKIKPDVHIDKHVVIIGALLHDIGSFMYPPQKPERIKHGIEGAKILEKEGLHKISKIAERHIGIGIKKEDIITQKLPLPMKDYLPITIEEKIVCYSDNLIKGTTEMDEEWVIERFSTNISPEYEQRTIEFHNNIHKFFKK